MKPIHLDLSREELESSEYRRFEADTDYAFDEEGIDRLLAYWSKREEEEEE